MILTPLVSLPWKFRAVSSTAWLPATVPGCVHADLRAAGRIPDPFFGANEQALQWIGETEWEYRVHFTVGAEALAAEATELVADGLDTVTTVYLNDREVARTDNMFIAHRWPVRRLLRRGRNELRVVFHSAEKYLRTQRTNFTPPREHCDPVGNAVRLRKQPSQFGWDWAPRLVTAGIWRDIRLESWTGNRLAGAHFAQHHDRGRVALEVTPRFARAGRAPAVLVECRRDGREVARATGAGPVRLEIPAPELWWPAGQGAQPLYDLTVTVLDPRPAVTGVLRRRIGLRTIVLDRHRDQWGESFQFVVNGRPIFAKGANWIPAHSFVAGLTRRDYARDLGAAVAANMNCLRLWGGGIYESEHFYDLCDELGLLVWHDFMFSCALYPSDAAFLKSVRQEAVTQVSRLQHRACLALWCGNNELAQLNRVALLERPALMRGYLKLFHALLPAVVAEHDGVTTYWPSSEWRGDFEGGHAHGEKRGDSHYWDVWHARHPVKDYEQWAFRFVSEYGMQSYSSAATNATFCPPHDTNVFGPAMEAHQKNPLGNQIILDYVSRRYRYPCRQDDLLYLSQLNQAYCMQVGTEHYRRLMPRCMGALYWQLNDCWPATSWSSIEFTGRWKVLHHAARRFFAPALVTAHLPGDETTRIGNLRATTICEAHLYTVYDGPSPVNGVLRWELRHLDGRTLHAGRKGVRLRPGESMLQRRVPLAPMMARCGRENLYLRLRLEVGREAVSEQAVFLTAPRHMPLPRGVIRAEVEMTSPRVARVTVQCPVFQHAVELDWPGCETQATDNYFDLFPDEAKSVFVTFDQPITPDDALQLLRLRALADACE
jgi:beta-mannosidase